jgi:hypothetical protein
MFYRWPIKLRCGRLCIHSRVVLINRGDGLQLVNVRFDTESGLQIVDAACPLRARIETNGIAAKALRFD